MFTNHHDALLLFAMKAVPPRMTGPLYSAESFLSWTNRPCFLGFVCLFFKPNPYGFINTSR